MAVEWHEMKFGSFHYAKIAPGFELRVEWSPDKGNYKIVFSGLVRTKREGTLTTALVAAEAFARAVLRKGLESIDTAPVPEPVTTKYPTKERKG